jgi:hypothetical protein
MHKIYRYKSYKMCTIVAQIYKKATKDDKNYKKSKST